VSAAISRKRIVDLLCTYSRTRFSLIAHVAEILGIPPKINLEKMAEPEQEGALV
jgi:hypothetical protein